MKLTPLKESSNTGLKPIKKHNPPTPPVWTYVHTSLQKMGYTLVSQTYVQYMKFYNIALRFYEDLKLKQSF